MHIYAILGTKMAAIRPSWVGSGKGWCPKMRIRPEYNFACADMPAIKVSKHSKVNGES